MAHRTGETPVAGDQRHIQRFGEGDVGSVVSREVVPQIPDTGQKETVRIAVHRKLGEYCESCAAAFAVDLTTERVTAECVRDLDIEQLRRVQRQACVEQSPFNDRRCGRLEENFDQSRSVDNDHSRSRSVRMTSAGDGETVTWGGYASTLGVRRASAARRSVGFR